MKLTGLHFLLTYRCIYECDHCFVWSSPRQPQTMTVDEVGDALRQAAEIDTVKWIYFEGGEPFLYYAALLDCVKQAAELGFKVGLVTNAYWATGDGDALRNLRPFAGLVRQLSISTDLYHGDELLSDQARHAMAAAEELGIPASTISIAQPGESGAGSSTGEIPPGTCEVMYRGRAAEKLAGDVPHHPWSDFDRCPHEDLREPGRLHVDPLGHLHVCQGITIGNLRERPLKEICEGYDPDAHPVVGPLLRGGPAALVGEHGLVHDERYADACHLCYSARLALRRDRGEGLAPDAVYGIGGRQD